MEKSYLIAGKLITLSRQHVGHDPGSELTLIAVNVEGKESSAGLCDTNTQANDAYSLMCETLAALASELGKSE